MSPLWRKRLYIGLGPERIEALLFGRGLKPKLTAQHTEVVAAAGGQKPWLAALERFAGALDRPEFQGAEVEVVLSNRLVQYAAIPFANQLEKYSEQEAYARHVLTQTHGNAAGQWDLRIQQRGAGLPRLVSAVDAALLNGLRQACADRRVRLRAVRPRLMAVYNRCRGMIAADPAWLVIAEPGYSLFALIGKGGFAFTNGVSHASLEELHMLLDRENLVSGLAEPCNKVYLHASGMDCPATGHLAKYDLVRLDGAPAGDPASGTLPHALAWDGVL